jgi:hypothetical protein
MGKERRRSCGQYARSQEGDSTVESRESSRHP